MEIRYQTPSKTVSENYLSKEGVAKDVNADEGIVKYYPYGDALPLCVAFFFIEHHQNTMSLELNLHIDIIFNSTVTQ